MWCGWGSFLLPANFGGIRGHVTHLLFKNKNRKLWVCLFIALENNFLFLKNKKVLKTYLIEMFSETVFFK